MQGKTPQASHPIITFKNSLKTGDLPPPLGIYY